MKRFICFPILNIEKTEGFLNRMERQGYRLHTVKFSRLFYFVESQPKDAKYIINYCLPKDSPIELYDWEEKLKAEYKALPVAVKNTKFDVFRITLNEQIDEDFFLCRKKYLKNVGVRLFLFISYMVFLILGCFILDYIYR